MATTRICTVFILRLPKGYWRFHEGGNVSGNGKKKLIYGLHAFLEMLTGELNFYSDWVTAEFCNIIERETSMVLWTNVQLFLLLVWELWLEYPLVPWPVRPVISCPYFLGFPADLSPWRAFAAGKKLGMVRPPPSRSHPESWLWDKLCESGGISLERLPLLFNFAPILKGRKGYMEHSVPNSIRFCGVISCF